MRILLKISVTQKANNIFSSILFAFHSKEALHRVLFNLPSAQSMNCGLFNLAQNFALLVLLANGPRAASASIQKLTRTITNILEKWNKTPLVLLLQMFSHLQDTGSGCCVCHFLVHITVLLASRSVRSRLRMLILNSMMSIDEEWNGYSPRRAQWQAFQPHIKAAAMLA